MCINFKIYFKEYKDKNEKVVLTKGNLFNSNWNTLKKKIIECSQNPFFQSNNLVVKDNDKFILEIEDSENKFNKSKLKSIFDERTFNYFIEKLNEYLDKNKEVKDLKIKFFLDILKNGEDYPKLKLELQNYDICLKDSLENIWQIEKNKIKNKLSKSELAKTENNFLNKNLKEYEKKEFYSNKNNNIVCNNCLTINFFGHRYICAYCDNFNLCSKCYNLGNHNPEHNFILFKKPIQNKEENDINKYDNKISPNYFIFKDKDKPFEINFKLVNTGEKDLNNCYIGYIKFDKNHLICKKYVIDKKLDQNSQEEIKLEINFDDIDNINCNTFEGHFRMFNEYGIPFGDILKIKVINGYISKIV